MIFLQFKGIIYYHTNLPKRRIIMPIFNPKMSLSDIHNNLNLSNELRIFCRFHKVPDASQFSKFRTNYHANLADMFRNLVDITEPICRKINEKKAKYPTTILQALNFLSRKTTLNSLKLNLMRLKNFPAPKRTALIPALCHCLFQTP